MELFNVYPRFETTPETGSGSFVLDQNGEKYLDLYGGHGVISVGHNHPHYTTALKDQLNKLAFYSNSVQMPIQEKYAQVLAEISGYPHHALFLCNSGAEANENALKLASFHTGRSHVIAFRGSFHGRTSLALAVTDDPSLSAPINYNERVIFLDLNDEAGLIAAFEQHEVCAVIVEGIQGVGGLDMPGPDFWLLMRALCDRHGALLIADEIQSGCGRTGAYFAHQHSGVEADIISMAKGIGNGFPMAAILIHPAIQAKFGLLGTTFGGSYLACAAGIAVVEILRDEALMTHALHLESWLRKELSDVHGLVQIKGKGLMLGLEFSHDCAELRKHLLLEGKVYTGSSKNNRILRILPPLTITQEELQAFIVQIKEFCHA